MCWRTATPLIVTLSGLMCIAQESSTEAHRDAAKNAAKLAPPVLGQEAITNYVLGTDDQISIRVVNCDEINDKPIPVDLSGYIHLPLVGSIKVSGRTVQQLQNDITDRLKAYVLHPDVSVVVVESRSQPVSVIGAVRSPGVQQVRGRKTLLEILSLVGGVDPQTAGSTVKITRELRWGRIPLAKATDDSTKQFSIAQVNLKSLIDAKHPEENIPVKPNDVISVPRAQTIFVIGEVQKAGGYILNDGEDITVLQALAMAGGLDRMAKAQDARILRRLPSAITRTEISVDLRKILEGKGTDVHLQPDDILFVPNSISKRVAVRAIEAIIANGSGMAIFSRP